ncbi:MAG TPA: metallophosphoesterase [Urbifossiella sp.]|nr:metallophosphoesterase [Urbifossiella sp.]
MFGFILRPSSFIPMPIRLIHFSDVHLTAPRVGWRFGDLFTKRGTGWVNVRLRGRGHRFRYANQVVEALLADCRTRGYDQLVFSGDATTMAFDTEMTESAKRLGVWDATLPPALAVPGNHDLYTFGVARRRTFEFAFSAWQQGERADDTHTYPFAKKVGHVWLIALNSAKPNALPWDATGRVGSAQLERLKVLCEKLDAGPRVVVSHYPLLTRGRHPEARWHRLLDWAEARDAAAACGVGLWLHGHKHAWYVLEAGENQPFHSVCVGSTCQEKLWGYHEYEIDGTRLRGLRRVFDLSAGEFVDADRFELELNGA